MKYTQKNHSMEMFYNLNEIMNLKKYNDHLNIFVNFKFGLLNVFDLE